MGLSSQSISREAESRQLGRRLLTALVGVPLVIGAIWAGLPWLTILVGLAALLALREFYGMAFGPRLHPLMALGALWTGLFIVGGHFTDAWYEYTIHLMLAAGLVVALPWLTVMPSRKSWPAGAYGIAGPIYVGFLLAHSLMLRGIGAEAGYARDWLLFALVVTFATDTGAFAIGKVAGRHLMAPSISPGKTWEGAFGGFVSAICIALILGVLLELTVPLWQAALVGAAVGSLAQMGDLVESRIKRATGFKDASGILPGHGGLLDRLDSIVFTVPVVYYLVALVFVPSS